MCSESKRPDVRTETSKYVYGGITSSVWVIAHLGLDDGVLAQ